MPKDLICAAEVFRPRRILYVQLEKKNYCKPLDYFTVRNNGRTHKCFRIQPRYYEWQWPLDSLQSTVCLTKFSLGSRLPLFCLRYYTDVLGEANRSRDLHLFAVYVQTQERFQYACKDSIKPPATQSCRRSCCISTANVKAQCQPIKMVCALSEHRARFSDTSSRIVMRFISVRGFNYFIIFDAYILHQNT